MLKLKLKQYERIHGGRNVPARRFVNFCLKSQLEGGAQVSWLYYVPPDQPNKPSPENPYDNQLTKKYKNLLIENEICGICLESMINETGQLAYCSDCYGLTTNPPTPHIFHKACLETWTTNHPSCPICKQPCQSNPDEETAAQVQTQAARDVSGLFPLTQEQLVHIFESRLEGLNIDLLCEAIKEFDLNLNFQFEVDSQPTYPFEWAWNLSMQTIRDTPGMFTPRQQKLAALPSKLAQLGATCTQEFLEQNMHTLLNVDDDFFGFYDSVWAFLLMNGRFDKKDDYNFNLNFKFILNGREYTPLSYILHHVHESSTFPDIKDEMMNLFMFKGADPAYDNYFAAQRFEEYSVAFPREAEYYKKELSQLLPPENRTTADDYVNPYDYSRNDDSPDDSDDGPEKRARGVEFKEIGSQRFKKRR